MKNLICRVLTLVFMTNCLLPANLVWGQQSAGQMQKRVADAVLKQTAQQDSAAQKQALKEQMDQAFAYRDIVQAVYQLHDYYTKQYQLDVRNQPANAAFQRNQQRALHMPESTRVAGSKNQDKLTNPVLSAIAANTLDGEQILDFIDPLSPAEQKQWDNTSYAALYLTNLLTLTTDKYPGLENFLRHAQMRILARLSSAGDIESALQAQAMGELAVAFLMIHQIYKRLYGQDPLDRFDDLYPYARELPVVTITAQKPAKTSGAANTQAAAQPAAAPKLSHPKTQWVRNKLMAQLESLQDEAASSQESRYSLQTLMEAIKGRNQTAQFSAWDGAMDLTKEFFFFINMIPDLWEFGKSLVSDTDIAERITALVTAITRYDLMEHNFTHFKQLLDTLEPPMLAQQNSQGTGAVFLNNNMYQTMQPAVAEAFNTLYVYAISPDRTPEQWTAVMDLLAECSDPYKYSIMTRLSALAVAAKLLDLRTLSQHPEKAGYRIPVEAHNGMKNFKVANEYPTLPPSFNQKPNDFSRNAYYIQTGKAPYHFADTMAQRIVDIYQQLTANGTLAGMQDFGMDATQMKTMADQLAKLYNIFAQHTSARFPEILPLSQETSETVTQRVMPNLQNNLDLFLTQHAGAYEEKTVITRYGAKVTNSRGQVVYMHLDNPKNSSKFIKDGGDFLTQFAVDVVSWKTMVTLFRAGKNVTRGLARFMKPKKAAVLTLQGSSAGKNNPFMRLSMEQALQDAAAADEASLSKLSYVLNHPIPDITTRAQLNQFLGVPANATDQVTKRALKKLLLSYHPDKLPHNLTDLGSKFVREQVSKLTELENWVNKGFADKVAPQAAKEAAKEAAEKAAAKAAKVDHNSLGNIAAGFAQFFAIDYLLSFPAAAVQENMAEKTEKAINKKTEAIFAANHAQTDDGQLHADQPLAMLEEVRAAQETSHQGGFVTLPLYTLLSMRNPLDNATIAAQLKRTSHILAFNYAVEQQGKTIEKEYEKEFAKEVDHNIDILKEDLSFLLQDYQPILAASSTGQKEIKQTYQTAIQHLRQAKQVAATDLGQAQALAEDAIAKFNQTKTDILLRCRLAYVRQQTQQQKASYENHFRSTYGDVITEQDIEKVNQIIQAMEQMNIEFYKALYRLERQAYETGKSTLPLQEKAIQKREELFQQLQAKFALIETDLMVRQQQQYGYMYGYVDEDEYETIDPQLYALGEQAIQQALEEMYPAETITLLPPETLESVQRILIGYVERINELARTAQDEEDFLQQLEILDGQRKLAFKGVLKRSVTFPAQPSTNLPTVQLTNEK